MNKERLLKELNEEIISCRRCDLYKTRTKAVPGEGNPEAKIMFVGESPGGEEDLQGRPFVGRSGRFLDELLRSVGIERSEVYITSVLKSRPPSNVTPRLEWIEACKPYLERQLRIIDPSAVVLLGGVALKALLKTERVKDVHGKVFKRNGRRYIPTYHPAAGMRFPSVRRIMIEDFKKIKEESQRY